MLYHVFANKSNAGDWLSALAIQRLIQPFEAIELFCDEPFVRDTLLRLAFANRNDFIVIGGGGLFMDYFDPFWEGFAPIAKRVPYCIWGVGYCDLKETSCLPRTSRLPDIVQGSRLCVVRDELTRGYLGLRNVSPSLACPSMVLATEPSKSGKGVLHVAHHEVLGPDRRLRITAMIEQFAAECGRPYLETHHRFSDGSHHSLEHVLENYAHSELVVTSRLHGCIIAVAMGRKVLAISGDRKVEGFMAEAGLIDWVCDIRNLQALPCRLRALPAQIVPRRFVDEVRSRHQQVAAQVIHLIEEAAGAADQRRWLRRLEIRGKIRRHLQRALHQTRRYPRPHRP